MASSGITDIVHYRWLDDCVAASQYLPLEPKYFFGNSFSKINPPFKFLIIRYMIYTLPETKKRFLKEIDEYGDSYTKDTDVSKLKEVFAMITKIQERDKPQSEAPIRNSFLEVKNSSAFTKDLPKRKLMAERSKDEIEEEVNLKRKKVEALKALLKELGLRVSGSKDELVQRILNFKYTGEPDHAKRVKREDEEEPPTKMENAQGTYITKETK